MEPYQNNPSTPSFIPGSTPNMLGYRREVAPSAVPSLIFGIISLTTMALFGWIMAIVALNHVRKAKAAMELEPDRYSEASARLVKAGRTMGTLGLIFGLLGILVWIIYIVFIVYLVSQSHSYNHYPSYY